MPVFRMNLSYYFMSFHEKKILITGSPLDMRILGLGKTRISGKSHSKNQKVVILYCMIFLMYEIKITFSAVSLLIIYYMIYKTNQSFEFGCCQLQFLDDKFRISRIFSLENCISRILGEPFEKSHK